MSEQEIYYKLERMDPADVYALAAKALKAQEQSRLRSLNYKRKKAEEKAKANMKNEN